MDLNCYLVTYGISSPKRLRRVFETLVFGCDLTPVRLVAMVVWYHGTMSARGERLRAVRWWS